MSSSSPMAVHDARAIEVVGRQLDPHAIAGEDPDAEAAHLAGDVPEDRVPVVELDAEHGVGQGLHHLALELDLLLLGHGPRSYARSARAGAAVVAAVGRRRLGLRGLLRRRLVEVRVIAAVALALALRLAVAVAVAVARLDRRRARTGLRRGRL